MQTVEVSFSALPAHVRTARLVAIAVARRAGVDETLLDEIRLAVGEACSRAVTLHQRHAPDQLVRVRLVDDQDRFTVEVSDRGPPEGGGAGSLDKLDPETLAAPGDLAGDPPGPVPDPLPPGFGLAVITGLVDDVSVLSEPDGTRVQMSWPAPHTTATDPGG